MEEKLLSRKRLRFLDINLLHTDVLSTCMHHPPPLLMRISSTSSMIWLFNPDDITAELVAVEQEAEEMLSISPLVSSKLFV